jgi:hypothetical protein
LITVLEVWKIVSKRTRLGKYTAPVSGEKKPAAVTISTIHHCRESVKAEYSGIWSEAGAFSMSLAGLVGILSSDDSADGGTDSRPAGETVDDVISFDSIVYTKDVDNPESAVQSWPK